MVEALVVAGDEAEVRRRLLNLLSSGVDELLLSLVPVADEEGEFERLFKTVGSL